MTTRLFTSLSVSTSPSRRHDNDPPTHPPPHHPTLPHHPKKHGPRDQSARRPMLHPAHDDAVQQGAGAGCLQGATLSAMPPHRQILTPSSRQSVRLVLAISRVLQVLQPNCPTKIPDRDRLLSHFCPLRSDYRGVGGGRGRGVVGVVVVAGAEAVVVKGV